MMRSLPETLHKHRIESLNCNLLALYEPLLGRSWTVKRSTPKRVPLAYKGTISHSPPLCTGAHTIVPEELCSFPPATIAKFISERPAHQ